MNAKQIRKFIKKQHAKGNNVVIPVRSMRHINKIRLVSGLDIERYQPMWTKRSAQDGGPHIIFCCGGLQFGNVFSHDCNASDRRGVGIPVPVRLVIK